MSLPSALNIDVSEIRDFRKTLISFHPEEISRLYKPGEKITFNFPKGLLDLSSFNIFFDAQTSFYRLVEDTNNNTFYSLNYNFPKHTQSLIQRLRVFINKQEISNIYEYNYLYALIYDIKNYESHRNGADNQTPEFKTLSDDGINNDVVLNVGYSEDNVAGLIDEGWLQYAAQPTETFKESFSISQWIGFFQDIKYINTHNIDLSIEIDLAPANIMFYQDVGANSQRRAATDNQILDQAGPDYSIWNVKANIHKLDFEGAPNMINNNLTFTDYTSKTGQKLDINKTQKLTMNIKSDCINKLIGTFLDYERDGVYGFQSARSQFGVEYERLVNEGTRTNLGNSVYFSRIGKGVETASFYIDDIAINNNPMTMLEIEKEVKHAFNINKTLWRNIYEFENSFFAAVMSLEDHVKKNNEIVKTGYNTQDRYVKIMFETQAITVNANVNFAEDFRGTPILFVEMERTIEISNSNVKIM